MALTFTKIHSQVNGDRREAIYDILLDNSYTTGGYAVAATDVGFHAKIHFVTVNPTAGLLPSFDHANGKLQVFYPTGGSTAPAALAAPIVKSGAATASAVDATTPNIVAGQGKEVANTTDLSTITIRVRAIGR